VADIYGQIDVGVICLRLGTNSIL